MLYCLIDDLQKGFIMLKKKLLAFDFILFFLTLCMIVIGLTAIGSANRINTMESGLSTELLNSEFFNQVIWSILGVLTMLVVSFIDYHFICKFYVIIYIVNLILLVLVLAIGTEISNVKRWIFGIQPSEFSKIFMIIFLASFIDKHKDSINEFKTLFFLFILVLIPVYLINKQPSLSASLVLLAIFACQIFVGKINLKYIKIVFVIVMPIVVILGFDLMSENQYILSTFLKEYQISRITSIIDFDLNTTDSSLYQTKHSVWAIGSGQLIGKGLFNGNMNQLNYIPYSYNDFIFAIIGEEFGFIGCFCVLMIALLIILKCLLVANSSLDDLGMLIVVGVVGMLFFQIFVNTGVATSLLPNTGMPFPFLSAGGSSMLVNTTCIGLVINVGMAKPRNLFEN